MSVVRKAAQQHDLVRLMADEGAELPPASQGARRQVSPWLAVHDEVVAPEAQSMEEMRAWMRARRSWAEPLVPLRWVNETVSRPQPLRAVGTAGNHGDSYSLRRMDQTLREDAARNQQQREQRAQVRPTSFGYPAGMSPVRQVPRQDRYIVDDLADSYRPIGWRDIIGRRQ